MLKFITTTNPAFVDVTSQLSHLKKCCTYKLPDLVADISKAITETQEVAASVKKHEEAFKAPIERKFDRHIADLKHLDARVKSLGDRSVQLMNMYGASLSPTEKALENFLITMNKFSRTWEETAVEVKKDLDEEEKLRKREERRQAKAKAEEEARARGQAPPQAQRKQAPKQPPQSGHLIDRLNREITNGNVKLRSVPPAAT
eukprot:TRINITY_DN589_c0_g1_i1.p1 TRINITY_DN589_c0_g1~~TRINITY_DN589_c0_g1_i1.p1  ORF type:complete len:202 (-),score=39.69 TRINITY_DN589_c0_g1_i1:96-701(-)